MDVTQPLQLLMQTDHARLDSLLRLAAGEGDGVAHEAFAALRDCLLRHLAIEEDILFPLVGPDAAAAGLREQLRADHAELRALLEQPATSDLIDLLRRRLAAHAEREDGPTGIYAVYDHLSLVRSAEFVQRICAFRDERAEAPTGSPADDLPDEPLAVSEPQGWV